MDMIIDIFGWTASILLIVSYACKNVTYLRILNMAASICFIVYGVLLNAPSIIILNASLFIVNICHLKFKEKFANFIADNKVKVIVTFCIYAIAMLIIAVTTSDGLLVEVIGTISSIIFVAGFIMSNERDMRIVCSIGTVLNIIYAILVSAVPVIVTNSCSLGVNVFRLSQVNNTSSKIN